VFGRGPPVMHLHDIRMSGVRRAGVAALPFRWRPGLSATRLRVAAVEQLVSVFHLAEAECLGTTFHDLAKLVLHGLGVDRARNRDVSSLRFIHLY